MATVRTGSDLVPASRLVRVYLSFLCFVLAGYAVFGKDFAYLGFPPLYIGEIALILGAAVALIAGNLTGAIFNLPGLALALLILWSANRTIPYWKQYELDAPRDAMIVFYGLFAYVIASIVLQRPSAFLFLVERYKRFISYAIFLAPIVVVLSLVSPMVTGPKAADLACHLTAIFGLALLGFIRLRPLAFILVLLFELFAFTQAREAMAVFVVGSSLAAVLSQESRALRRFSACIGVFAAVVGVLFVVDFHLDSADLRRPISVRQYVANVTSTFTGGDNEDETREWRLNWWSDIISYTIHGPYFWTGKGFGPNIADTDGYQTSGPDEAPLRSPHNAHMTILARGGVPELVLWISALGAWLGAVMRQLMEARRLRDGWWANIFAFLLIYWTSILVASSFDVVLEGPVMGIWFWTIHGIGLASLVLHRHRVAMLQGPRLGAHAPFAG